MGRLINNQLDIRAGAKPEPKPPSSNSRYKKHANWHIPLKGDAGQTDERIILSVEDHADTRDMLVVLLELHGYRVKTIGGDGDVITLVRKESFDLYLIGDMLPFGSNLDLA